MPAKDYIKRIFTWYFDTDKILNSYRTRKGKCKRCGKCCYLWGLKCPFLNKKKRCMIYRFRPLLLCKIPPLNLSKGEIKKHKEIKCGFYWSKNYKNKK